MTTADVALVVLLTCVLNVVWSNVSEFARAFLRARDYAKGAAPSVPLAWRLAQAMEPPELEAARHRVGGIAFPASENDAPTCAWCRKKLDEGGGWAPLAGSVFCRACVLDAADRLIADDNENDDQVKKAGET